MQPQATDYLLDPDTFRPAGDHILLFKCVNEEPGGLVLPDKTRDRTNWLEVVAVGPRCEVFTDECVGKLVHAPNWSDSLTNHERTFGKGYWICRERNKSGDLALKPFVVEPEE